VAIISSVFVAGLLAGQQGAQPSNDPIARLAKSIERGEVRLEFGSDGWGYLPSLLKQLDVHIDSQGLVFSKTSFQLTKISPKTPRAIYFNDSVSIGAVQDGPILELTALDPSHGIRYYTMDNRKGEPPKFEQRFGECLNCHGPSGGLVVSSVYPAADGTPFVTGSFFWGIDHRTPMENRWGGWYVTGTHGSVEHMGNVVAPDPDRPLDLESGGQNLTSLAGKLDPTKYLAPTSDIVALMTLEHQTRMTNYIVAAGQQFRRASQTWSPDPRVLARLDTAVEDLVAYMLFAEEAPLGAPVKGVSTFTETFAKRGPRDKQGRSLRDYDLRKRLFRYPLSYMIYSESFDAMPAGALERVYRRLHDVLAGQDTSEKFARLSADDRRAVLEILLDTKPALPAYWRMTTPRASGTSIPGAGDP
jgi:hypothetical protein